MTRERRFSLMGAAALLVALPLVAAAQTTPATTKVFSACYGSLTGVVYRIKEPGLPTRCLHPTHVEFSWTSGTGGAPVTDHGALQGLGNDDHPQYLLVDGSRALTGALRVGGNLSVGGNKVTDLAEATAAGEAVPYEQAVKSGDAASGDLSGTYPAPTVTKLQNTAVSAVAPASGQVLGFDGSAWTPTAAPTGGASGISGWVRLSSTASVAGGDSQGLLISCPEGKKVLAGGYSTLMDVRGSFPDEDRSWVVVFVNNDATAHEAELSVTCANAAP